jgi:hypothetical protein
MCARILCWGAIGLPPADALGPRKPAQSPITCLLPKRSGHGRLGLRRDVPQAVISCGRLPSQAATQMAGLTVSYNRLAYLRRFQYAIAKMATQLTALIVKQAANHKSERLMRA